VSSRRRALFATLVALGTIYAGLLVQQKGVLILSLPLLVYAAALIVSDARLKTPRISVARNLETNRLHEQEEVEIELVVRHDSIEDVRVSLTDDIGTRMDVVDGERHIVGVVPPREEARTTYTVGAERGHHEQRFVRGSLWAPWGLAVRDIRLQDHTRLSALPEIEPVGDIEIRPRRTHAFAGSIRTDRSGSGLEIHGCREYVLGDDIRKINWRASARREELIVNLFEQEKMTDVNLIVDARAHMHVRVGKISTFDVVLRGAAGVASHFLQRGNRVGLLVYGDSINWTYPASGRLQMESILHSLADARPSSREVFGKLRQIPTQLFSTGSQLILFSALETSEDAEVPEQLVARGYSVMLVHPDTTLLQLARLGEDPIPALAARTLRLESEASLGRMAKAGVHIVDWDVREPLAVAFHAAQASLRGGRR